MKKLDKYQEAILNIDDNIRIIAGAGSGKTFTLLSKIKYLIEENHVSPNQILVISFTNASVDDIKNKTEYNIEILTFHKLAIKILDNCNLKYQIISNNALSFLINEYLINISKKEQSYILQYLKYQNNYKHFLKSQQFNYFKRFIESFINQFLANNYSTNIIRTIKYNQKERKILTIIFKIIYLYNEEKRSNNSLDLNDLITTATEYIKYSNLNYKYIFIDEFQDTSFLRFNLINEIVKKCKSKLIVVGDDWQSIYRFTGCNLNIFVELEKFVNNLKTVTLINNYRNSNEILQVSKKFIEKNKYQIKKDLHSNINIKNSIIFLPYTKRINSFKNLLQSIINKNIDDVMVLSRNNYDIYHYIDEDFNFENDGFWYKNKYFKYFTIHRSKGLEANVVILLNCNNDRLGFPNMIEDNSIIKKTFSSNEPIFAEERRLMYVALTRTKSYIYLLYDKKTPSNFIIELKKIKSSNYRSF